MPQRDQPSFRLELPKDFPLFTWCPRGDGVLAWGYTSYNPLMAPWNHPCPADIIAVEGDRKIEWTIPSMRGVTAVFPYGQEEILTVYMEPLRYLVEKRGLELPSTNIDELTVWDNYRFCVDAAGPNLMVRRMNCFYHAGNNRARFKIDRSKEPWSQIGSWMTWWPHPGKAHHIILLVMDKKKLTFWSNNEPFDEFLPKTGEAVVKILPSNGGMLIATKKKKENFFRLYFRGETVCLEDNPFLKMISLTRIWQYDEITAIHHGDKIFGLTSNGPKRKKGPELFVAVVCDQVASATIFRACANGVIVQDGDKGFSFYAQP